MLRLQIILLFTKNKTFERVGNCFINDFCCKTEVAKYEPHTLDADCSRYQFNSNYLFSPTTSHLRLLPLTYRLKPQMDNYSQSFVTTSSVVSSLPVGSSSTPPPQSVTNATATQQPGGGPTPCLCASRCTVTLWS